MAESADNASSAARLSVQNLSKNYGEVKAVQDLSFSSGGGEILGLLGPNGAGKTTVIHMLLGMLKPSGGDVRIFGMSPFQEKYKIYPRINFSSAYVQLPYNLRAEHNLMIFARLYAVPNPHEKIRELMERFQIEHRARSLTGALSSGEQTRLNLCKSLLNDPDVLFLDEPTASLDPDIAERVRGVLKQIRREKNLTIIYTSHNMAEVEDLCERVIFIHLGRKIIEGTPARIRQHFNKESLEKVFIHVARSGDLNSLLETAG